MCNEHAYVLAIERLMGIEAPERAQWIRTLFDEVTRILNHLMWVGSSAPDLGAMAVFLYAFREDRKRVVEGTRVSVRVDLGGRRLIKKKNQNTTNNNGK